jgi:hypothetical protein
LIQSEDIHGDFAGIDQSLLNDLRWQRSSMLHTKVRGSLDVKMFPSNHFLQFHLRWIRRILMQLFCPERMVDRDFIFVSYQGHQWLPRKIDVRTEMSTKMSNDQFRVTR